MLTRFIMISGGGAGVGAPVSMVKIADSKIAFLKSLFTKRPMVKRALFIRNQLGLVFVYKSMGSVQ